MKKQSKQSAAGRAGLKWPWVLLIQAVLTLAAMLLLGLSLWLGGILHSLCLWVLTPLAGFISACIATRKGFLNYGALLVPPIAQMAAGLILWGYLPATGPVFVCGFISLVGAATGEVLKRQHTK